MNNYKEKLRSTLIISAFPILIYLIFIVGPFQTDAVYPSSGIAVDLKPGILPGSSSIDPNVGFTSLALGGRAAGDVLSGHLPLWNHFEGLGAPLLGEMQSAALFPPTLLLALPHGQVLEQALLQLMAGFGCFLFFRRFGLGDRAALTGSLLYELNGVFAWLRNAVFNPVAFLPWLFFAIEALRAAILAQRTRSQRAPMICLAAGMSALALYAGFPEQVYLYSLLLVGWVVFRMRGCTLRHIIALVTDLLLAALVCLGLSAPLLLAFVDFLGEGALAGHGDGDFLGHWLDAGALLQYLTPYIFGPIFSAPSPQLSNTWGSIGGYVGFVPVVAALAGLFIPHQRAAKAFLVGWIVLAIGVSHGMPGLYPAFMALPLAKIAACYRYLNPSWIFCIVFLSVLFLDRIPALPRRTVRNLLASAVALGLVLVACAAAGTWPLLTEFWTGSLRNRHYVAGSAIVVAILSLVVLGAASGGSTKIIARTVCCLLVAEAGVSFLVPLLSSVRGGKLDWDAIDFLRSNVGYQRVVAISGNGLGPNFGSYFGIATLNYNDLPVPRKTVSYIKDNLDPFADPIVFLPWYPPSPPEKQEVRQKLFLERLPRYAAAGVRYVLAPKDFKADMPLAHRSESLNIYELPGTRAYVSAGSCTVIPLSRDRIETSCANPTKLTRLEVRMRGWSATINGQSVPIGLADDTFQTLDLPSGIAEVQFEYRPTGILAALLIACATASGVLAILARTCLGRIRHTRLPTGQSFERVECAAPSPLPLQAGPRRDGTAAECDRIEAGPP